MKAIHHFSHAKSAKGHFNLVDDILAKNKKNPAGLVNTMNLYRKFCKCKYVLKLV